MIKKFFLVFALLFLSATLTATQEQIDKSIFDVLQHRLSPQNLRYPTFAKALSLMQERGVKIIVETGTTRGINLSDIFSGDGGSTILFADWASKNNAIMYSVDIEDYAFVNAAPFVINYQNHLVTVCEDSVTFLQNFPDTIDMLYLDSFDFDANDPVPSQEHHLKEIIAAYPRLNPNSIILIDDCGLPHGGKGKLAINYLIQNGWKIVLQGYQVLLVRI